MKTLTDSETWSIANALRVAAEQYAQDGAFYSPNNANAEIAEMPAEARASMARQFDDQAAEARRLAGLLENAGAVTIAA